ncbi:MAG: SDR family oxidoreductase [Proteobacteria bacterium]|nr:SDR family oxidoreductase [Pseudomonadota bacterium]
MPPDRSDRKAGRPADRTADELGVGLTDQFERAITEADVLSFARGSGDQNPLHVDVEYAETTNYGGRIVHGAFQVGLASALVGMYLPGRRALLASIHARFMTPLYYPCRVAVRGEITAWDAGEATGRIRVVITETEKAVPVSEITCGVTLHRQKTEPGPVASVPPPGITSTPASSPASNLSAGRSEAGHISTAQPPAKRSDERKTVLVTGASGGIGSAIALDLAGEYHILAMAYRNSLSADLADHPGVTPFTANLDQADWEQRTAERLAGAPLYGVVHAAWPGAPTGGLLDAAGDVVQKQLSFATSHTIRLARFLFQRVDSGGGRLVALGSMWGSHHPNLSVAPYSLAKGALESTVRLLAPELARKAIAINTVCPSFVAAGANKQVSDRARKRFAARVPMARLCAPDDVAAMVRYLFSDGASFVSGQALALSGAEL